MQDRPKKNDATLYDADFAVWCHDQARLVRERRFDELDVENVAEELNSLGRAIRREIADRAQVLIMLLLRWRHQPELRGRGWSSTILRQRLELKSLADENPSLKDPITEAILTAYPEAVADADRDAGPLGFPEAPPFTPEQALDLEFLPNDLDGPV